MNVGSLSELITHNSKLKKERVSKTNHTMP